MTRPTPPARALSAHPDLDQLKREAKELLDEFRSGAPDAVAEVTAHYRRADPLTFALHDAQLVLARSYGFESWPMLKAYVDNVTVNRLADAVRSNDIARVRRMLDARPELVNMDMAESDEHRALHYAVLNRSPDMVRLIMERGADAQKGIWPHRDATSALTIASERGYGEILDIITAEEERRAAGRRPDPALTPALHRLFEESQGNEARAIAFLEAHPAVIQERGPDGWTPLHLATSLLYERMINWLLDHGADVNAVNNGGNTPLAVTGSRCRWDDSARNHSARVQRLLMDRGAELTVFAAVALGDVDWLRGRHDDGERWPSEYGLLTSAVMNDSPDVLACLLDLGLDPDERVRSSAVEETLSSWGEPLRQCAIARRHAMAEMLLGRGADPNTNVYAASNAMFIAYEARDRTMLELLERHGGVIDAGVAGHFGLLDRARQMLADEASGQLRERAVHPGGSVAASLLVSGADGGRPDVVRLALDHLDWPAGDPRWHWNLMRPLGGHADADRDRFFTCFRLMLERAGPDVPAPYGRTILHDVAAAWPRGSTTSAEERVVLATMLLDAGARLDVRDDLLKSTPLGWACRWGRIDVVRLLLQRGADPIEADAEPWATPLAWAEKMKHGDVAALLRDASGSGHQ